MTQDSENSRDAAATEPTLTVGVVVAREAIDSPWQDHAWRPVEVLVPPPPVPDWTLLRETEAAARYYVGAATVELHRNEADGYMANIAGDEPCLYVVLQPGDGPERPLALEIVTASPTEVQAYGHDGNEIIGAVPMPAAVEEAVLAFAMRHRRAEAFVKRVRQKHLQPEVHQFGQEPIVELRRRMAQRNDDGEGDG